MHILVVVDVFDVTVKLMSVILGGLAVSLISVIIGLIVKIQKLQKGTFTVLLYFHLFI